MYTVPDVEKMTARIGVRFTTVEHKHLAEEAAAHGLTLSQLVRAKATGVKIRSRIKSQAIAELRRQGDLLRYLTKTTNIDKLAVEVTLERIREAIAAISK